MGYNRARAFLHVMTPSSIIDAVCWRCIQIDVYYSRASVENLRNVLHPKMICKRWEASLHHHPSRMKISTVVFGLYAAVMVSIVAGFASDAPLMKVHLHRISMWIIFISHSISIIIISIHHHTNFLHPRRCSIYLSKSPLGVASSKNKEGPTSTSSSTASPIKPPASPTVPSERTAT